LVCYIVNYLVSSTSDDLGRVPDVG